MASGGEVAELQPAEYPSLHKRVQVPTVAVKCHNNAKNLEPLFWFVHSGLLYEHGGAMVDTKGSF